MSSNDETLHAGSDDSVYESREKPEPREITDDGVLHVYEAGELLVLGFAGRDVPTGFNVAHYRDAILELVKLHDTTRIAFDVTGVRLVPSGILGLWASLHQHGIGVEVYNPSEDITEVLEITKLNQFIETKQLDV